MNLKIIAAAVAMAGVVVLGIYMRPQPGNRPASGPVNAAELTLPAPPPTQLASAAPIREANIEIPVAPPRPLEVAPTPEQAAMSTAETPPVAPASESTVAALPASLLDAAGWDARVPANARAAVIVVSQQHMYILEGRRPIWDAVCATATNGIGAEARSEKTPLGWHAVSEKFGDKAPIGQVFRSRIPTKELWKPGMSTKEDLVLTRVLWLDGLEPGKNKGQNAAGVTVDSKQRCIYIHGTNGENALGTPSSHGCIRLSNAKVVEAFDLLPLSAPVLIVE